MDSTFAVSTGDIIGECIIAGTAHINSTVAVRISGVATEDITVRISEDNSSPVAPSSITANGVAASPGGIDSIVCVAGSCVACKGIA